MSSAELSLLSKAYEHYLESSQIHFCYEPLDGTDLFLSTEAAAGLLESGYITNVPDSVLSDSISPNTIISFDITTLGINYMRSNRKL